MSFQQGLSGLNAAGKSLDVIGNNIANSSTVGFKQSQAQFADIYASSLNGVGGLSAGIGVSVSQIAQQFTQGNIETSQNPLDVAINGAGFFRTEVNGKIQYSRNGQFQADKNGFLINAQLANVTGYKINTSGKLLAGAPEPIQIDPSDMKPNATTTLNTQVNLSSTEKQPTVVPFNANDKESYNKQIPTDVYDSLGNAHVMSLFYVKTGEDLNGNGTWDVYASSDGVEMTAAKVAAAAHTPVNPDTAAARKAFQDAATAQPYNVEAVQAAAFSYAQIAGAAVSAAAVAANASDDQQAAIAATYADTQKVELQDKTPEQIDAIIGASVSVPGVKLASLNFNSNGVLDKTAMLAATPSQALPVKIDLPLFPTTGAAAPVSMDIDFTGSTQIATATGEKKTIQDGYAGGSLTRFAAGADGVITGQYSNGRTRPLAQIVLANFTNPNGLEPLGNNAWAESAASGGPIVGEPNSGTLGYLRSSAVEASNVDLTVELVNMITAQRAYQANSQTIKTQDSIMQTLVNLR